MSSMSTAPGATSISRPRQADLRLLLDLRWRMLSTQLRIYSESIMWASDSHVHEFYVDGKGWHDFDLTAATGGPAVAAGSSLANAVDTTQNVFRVHYIGVDSHVHEFYVDGTGWHDFDLTAATGGPAAAADSPLANAVDTTENLFRVHYVGVDSHVHEFYADSKGWHDFDITAATGGPAVAAGSALANAVDTTQSLFRVHYVGVDSHVHEFYVDGEGWHDFDLTAATGGPRSLPDLRSRMRSIRLKTYSESIIWVPIRTCMSSMWTAKAGTTSI